MFLTTVTFQRYNTAIFPYIILVICKQNDVISWYSKSVDKSAKWDIKRFKQHFLSFDSAIHLQQYNFSLQVTFNYCTCFSYAVDYGYAPEIDGKIALRELRIIQIILTQIMENNTVADREEVYATE